MANTGGHVLVVDDNVINRKQLARLLTGQGYTVTLAEDGRQAVAVLAAMDSMNTPLDVILLDILMPEMDGYQVLAHVKAQPQLRHIPVIMISALEEMESVVRCIELGAADYLPKPFKPALLEARLRASLVEKRLRDLELEYLEQAGRVADAAQAVEAGRFDPAALDGVAARGDALGRLARVFQRMAREVHLREQRLHRQLEQLRLDMEEVRRSRSEPATVWLPRDRQQALAAGESATLPDRTAGAALFADISGFTPLTAALTRELGLQRGAEELTRAIDQVYGALVAEVHRYGGSVIGFAGDAITCWLDADDGRRALACGLAMQDAMALCRSVTTPAGATFPLSVKVAAVAGPARRFLVGDPAIQVIEVVAGRTLDRLAAAEHLAGRGEVVAGTEIVDRFAGRVEIAQWRAAGDASERFALVNRLEESIPPLPWPALASALPDTRCRPWLLPAVYERIEAGGRQFLADLRPVTALFVNFRGIDYDADHGAGRKLDAYVRWAQAVAAGFDGTLVQVTMGDKGSYFCVAFGAPVSHNDDELRAVRAAQALLAPPPDLGFITGVHAGIAAGLARAGPYGSETRRTYGVQGDRVNLAARLMQAAAAGEILCDESVARPAGAMVRFEALPPIAVKGRTEPVQVYRPAADAQALSPASQPAVGRGGSTLLDALLPSEQLVLKVASVLEGVFPGALLADILPVESEKGKLPERLAALEARGLIQRQWPDQLYTIPDPAVREAAYGGMLFAQRRTLHRQVAEWYERTYAAHLAPHFLALARHWQAGDEPAKAAAYLEKAAGQAKDQGDYAEAERLLQRSMKLEAEVGVLSAGFYGAGAAPRGAPDYDAALAYALSRLEHELSPKLKYHNLWHTRDEVLPAVRRLAAMSGVSEEETSLLEVAAVYHDLGFVISPEEHERVGADAAAQVLPGFGFSSEQVAIVQGMILATRLPQSPHTLLEEILADADLDSLGRDDFAARSTALREEIAASGRLYTDDEWNARQIQFLLSHSYFTEAARSLRGEGKRKNLAALQGTSAGWLHAKGY